MNKVYLHLGVQKTGTTTLQWDIFPNIDGVRFVGRRRFSNDESGERLYKRICSYCFNSNTKESAVKLKLDISATLKNTDLLISEEWFLTDYNGFEKAPGDCWQNKVARLAILLSGFECVVIISKREPISALYSVFCQNIQDRKSVV